MRRAGARETHWATCHNGVNQIKTKEFLKFPAFLDLNGSSLILSKKEEVRIWINRKFSKSWLKIFQNSSLSCSLRLRREMSFAINNFSNRKTEISSESMDYHWTSNIRCSKKFFQNIWINLKIYRLKRFFLTNIKFIFFYKNLHYRKRPQRQS